MVRSVTPFGTNTLRHQYSIVSQHLHLTLLSIFLVLILPGALPFLRASIVLLLVLLLK